VVLLRSVHTMLKTECPTISHLNIVHRFRVLCPLYILVIAKICFYLEKTEWPRRTDKKSNAKI